MLLSIEQFSASLVKLQCPKQTMKMSWVRSLKMMIVLILWIMTLILHNTNAQIGGDWPFRIVDGAREVTECEGLGFPNATLNECGFCTVGNTGLPSNYSMDCSGSCNERAVVDCAGICGGSAYIDECSGQCIGGFTGLTEKNVESYRDCRGYCTSSGGTFYMDQCGVCHTGTSPFMDCTNTCHLPGFEYQMAYLICGRCVGSNTGVPVSEVLDQCGNCKSDTVECPCNGTGEPDVCGVCNGGGKSCMKVVDFTPKALPADVKANIAVDGAFRGRTKNLKCLFTPDTTEEVIEINASGNGTRVNCNVKLKAGTYRIGIRLDVGNPAETGYIEDSELFVYEEAEYTDMRPMKAVFDRDGSEALTVTFSGGKVPNIPLICIVTGEGWPTSQKLSPSEPNMLDSCSIPLPSSSIKLNVAPSFNGIHPFKKSFTLKFYASPPEMRDNYIAEDGHAAVIIFDRPVNLCNLKECSDILTSETLERVGVGATCEWATKQQLIITAQNPITTNPLRVTFKKGALKQDGQRYPLPKNESRTVDVYYPQPVSNVQLAINGPSTVSFCGTFTLTVDVYYPRPVSNAQLAISGPSTVPFCGTFTLVGHFASPKGDAQYFWTVFRADRRPLESTIADELLSIKTTSLTMDATLLEINMNYTFVLTAEHPVNEKYEARHVVCRKAYVGPLVTAYSDVMSQPSVTVDKKITLNAELTLPDCATESERMHLMWGVNNPKVKFNFKNRNLVVYHIQPYSLPESSEVIFTAYAYFSNMINVTTSRVVLRVEPFKLKVSIKGTVKRIVGNKDGNLVLDSEVSSLGFPVVYQWKCFEEDSPICYNYKKDSTEPLLIPRRIQSQPKLVIPCASLKAGQTLTFELKVFNANNHYQYSPVACTYVVVEDKNIPQVIIDSVIADGTHRIERHPNTGAYSIPAGLAVTVYATVTPVKSPLKSVKWEVKGFSSSFTYTSVNGKTMLSLEDGFLVGHGIYLIGLSACDGKGNCGIANLTIHAVPGIALCKLETTPFVEYETVNAVIKGCAIPLGRQPVTYQIFLHRDDSIFPLTAPQTPTVFKFIGPPYQSGSGTQMSVEVCDRYSLCKMFTGPRIIVRKSENVQEDRKKVLDKAVQAMRINDPLNALSLYLTVASGPDKLSESEINSMLNAGAKATSNRYLNAGQLSLIYSAMLPLVKQENNKVKKQALDVIKRATKLAFAHKIKVPTSILSQGHSNAAAALQAPKTDAAVINKVKNVLEYFVQKISATAPLGSRIQLSSENPGYPSSLIFRKLLDRSPVKINTLTENGMVEGSVKFEDAVLDKVRSRQCKGSRCDGIVVALTLYPDNNPYQSELKKTSPVMDITLRKPENGDPFRVADVTNGVRLALTHNATTPDPQTKGILYKCSYWDLETKDWAQEGLVTFGVDTSDGLMRCWSSHLTAFAVIETYDGLSAGSIVGIVVTVLMGIFIIMMLAFFYFRKKIAAKSRVSTEALQPKRNMDKVGMNGSHMRIKTVTP